MPQWPLYRAPGYQLLEYGKAATAHEVLETPFAAVRIPFRIHRGEHEMNVAGVIRAVEPLEHRVGLQKAQVASAIAYGGT